MAGGIANAGQVVRSGSHVLRPSTPHTESIHAFLRALRAAGFDGAPEPIGIDPNGRERLGYIEGEVPVAPYPAWCQTDAALRSVARLLRRFHDASRSFDPGDHCWSDALRDPAGGPVVLHNDGELSNVVFRDGVAVALIDFEFAAPGRPIYDLAHLARLWIPIDDASDQERLGFEPADRPRRLRVIVDAYGLAPEERADMIGALDDAMDRVAAAVRRRLEAGDPNFVDRWRHTDGAERYERRRRWWEQHRSRFVDVLA